MTHSESIKNIGAALLQFQGEVAKIPKTAANPFFKSKYAPLSAILDTIQQPMQNAGLTFVQFPIGENELETMLMHPDSGEWMRSAYHMKPVKSDPQSFGSVITYQRRYALGAILGLNIDEDDDGTKASEPAKEQPKKRPVLAEELYQKAMEKINAMESREERDAAYDSLVAKYEIPTDMRDNLIRSVEEPFKLV